jgi:hypothetical protein
MMYVKIGILIACFLGGWTINGWRMDAQHKDALEQQIESHNTQRAADLEKFKKDLKENVKIKTVFRTLVEEAANVPTTDGCTVSPNYPRVWNRANAEVSEIISSALYDPMRIAERPENGIRGLQGSRWPITNTLYGSNGNVR